MKIFSVPHTTLEDPDLFMLNVPDPSTPPVVHPSPTDPPTFHPSVPVCPDQPDQSGALSPDLDLLNDEMTLEDFLCQEKLLSSG